MPLPCGLVLVYWHIGQYFALTLRSVLCLAHPLILTQVHWAGRIRDRASFDCAQYDSHKWKGARITLSCSGRRLINLSKLVECGSFGDGEDTNAHVLLKENDNTAVPQWKSWMDEKRYFKEL